MQGRFSDYKGNLRACSASVLDKSNGSMSSSSVKGIDAREFYGEHANMLPPLHRRRSDRVHREVLVLDVGGADINGSYREIFNEPQFTLYRRGCRTDRRRLACSQRSTSTASR